MEQIEFIRYAVRTLDALTVPHALVGSWGSGLYGEPRFTRDVDMIVDLGLAAASGFCGVQKSGRTEIQRSRPTDGARSRPPGPSGPWPAASEAARPDWAVMASS